MNGYFGNIITKTTDQQQSSKTDHYLLDTMTEEWEGRRISKTNIESTACLANDSTNILPEISELAVINKNDTDLSHILVSYIICQIIKIYGWVAELIVKIPVQFLNLRKSGSSKNYRIKWTAKSWVSCSFCSKNPSTW